MSKKEQQYFYTCPYCGSNLDPGEICDCVREKKPEDDVKVETEKYLGTHILQSDFRAKREIAERKLEGIILREGDADGERRKPYYLAQLIAEAIREEMQSIICALNFEEKEARTEADNFQKQPHYSTAQRICQVQNCYGG